MVNPRLVICAESQKSSLLTPHFKAIIDQYFDVELYDATRDYDRAATIFVMSWYYNHDMTRFLDSGYKFFIDALWEARPFERGTLHLTDYGDNIYSGTGSSGVDPTIGNPIEVPNFFWYNESMNGYTKGYNSYAPIRTNSKKFLMPMGKEKPHRDSIYLKLNAWLDRAIYSYTHHGIYLPGTDSRDFVCTNRDFDPEWYNQTYYTIAVETFVEPAGFDLFITEKTFKPIAHRHPFMVWGTPGTMAYLKTQGFETFDHIFDEYYDVCHNVDIRLDNIVKNVETFCLEKYLDPRTEEKIEHNFQLFFNQDIVKRKYTEDVIYPLLEILQ